MRSTVESWRIYSNGYDLKTPFVLTSPYARRHTHLSSFGTGPTLTAVTPALPVESIDQNTTAAMFTGRRSRTHKSERQRASRSCTGMPLRCLAARLVLSSAK
jgi:hypothetical protein